MKKLLILTIALACMGCTKCTISSSTSVNYHGDYCDILMGDVEPECGWGREFSLCTCECEWDF